VKRLGALALFVLLLGSPASAGEPEASSVDVVVVSGYLDERAVDFVTDAIAGTDADIIVLQMDVPAVLSADFEQLVDLVSDPPVPVVAWVGPDPAVIHGGAVDVFLAAQIHGAAPGVEIGWRRPALAGGPAPTCDGRDCGSVSTTDEELRIIFDRVEVTGPSALVDFVVEPSIGQFIIGLHDRSLVGPDGTTIVAQTAIAATVDGQEVLRPAGSVRFVEPGLLDRVLRSAVGPEAAFFFLLVGAALAAFEFYAAGPGVAAAVAALCLFLAGYGISSLPVWWPGVAAAVMGIALYVIEFQRNDLGWKSALGTVLLLFGGLRFTDASPQIVPVWWVATLIVLGTALFFAFALTTVVRARFSTQTIGRDHLVGVVGVAVGPIAPDGEVEVDGARWRARSTRQSGITAGDSVRIVEVDGIVLQVDPL
jgi:membrane-bound serine protease (ClpP class)